MKDVLDDCVDVPVTEFSPGDTIVAEGKVADSLFLLIEGEVAVRKDGTEVSRISEPGAVFGEISALLGMETTARVAAATHVRVHQVDAAGEFLANHPWLALHTARTLALRLANATEYLADLKKQIDGDSPQFGMVDQVMDSLLQQQDKWGSAGRRN